MQKTKQKWLSVLTQFTVYLSLLMLVIGGGLALYAIVYGP
ncbi:3-ketoacyl-ACP reductase [Photobacterium sp. CCB-ST2H9]|nr:3-ketoacyl-ACP reductase [Photobacterium sp. CCB-ST2H9]UTM60049.1 3-ketoacyl-ACP reductase [Photobacterium sp. CCB-ST2H9]